MKGHLFFTLVLAFGPWIASAQTAATPKAKKKAAVTTATDSSAAKSMNTDASLVAPRTSLAPRPSSFEVEVTGGGGVSGVGNVEGINGVSLQSQSSVDAGVGVLMGAQRVQFETGLRYAEKGFKATQPNVFDLSLRLKYVELPVLARYSFQDRSGTHFFVKGGGNIGFLLDAPGRVDVVGGASTTESAKDSYNAVDLRMLVGAGVSVKVSRGVFWVIGVNAEYGLTKIVDTKDNMNPVNTSVLGTTGIAFRM